ncbi:putative acetyltransferase [Planotetraspora thailandica]|uniref:Putative acetyltransferase n=1 Tax=Planotetraspora thailandica TaxID=487172 RepID=A0A8J3V1J9_9ACTN|nr:GNAT family N-acetyltransferase [Planotetraspora thailandica]GII55592.1 putative acetyltransferase [Planotetraspora thailandica]
MNWTFTTDAEEYAAAAEPWLLRDPVRNTVPLTVLRGLRSGQFSEDPLMGWLTDERAVRGAFVHTAPYPLLLGVVPLGGLPALAAGLLERERSVAGVSGPLDVAEAFAQEWWRPEKDRRSERLYRLDALVPPFAPGRARTAVAADVDLATRWFVDFQREADVDVEADPTPVVSARINREELLLWEDGGRPVALACVSRPLAGMSRVGPVYTPPDHRRHGYGSAVTHAVTRLALDAGATEVLLFTDLANPTSNSIYQGLGYRPVADYATIHFG